jgi:hypothetical protein
VLKNRRLGVFFLLTRVCDKRKEQKSLTAFHRDWKNREWRQFERLFLFA